MNKRVLCVDDDVRILAAYQRNLHGQYEMQIARSGPEALALLREQPPFAVVVADMQMPNMNGIELLTAIEQGWPDTIRIMLTGNADQETAVQAVNQGHVYRFLTKPCPPEYLSLALDAGIQQHEMILGERDLLENTLNGAVKALIDIMAIMDPLSFAHAQILRERVRAYARHFNLAKAWTLEMAATLSRVGMVAIPPTVLLKARSKLSLSPEEANMLERVPQKGSELLARIPRLQSVAQIVLYQEKHFDGSGFPADSAHGEAIPLGARLLKILSDLQELETAQFTFAEAILALRQRPGAYDPTVLDSVEVCFDPGLGSLQPQKPMPVEATFYDLRAGQVLAAPAYTLDGIMLIATGGTISPLQMEKLQNFHAINNLKEPLLIYL